MPLAPSPCKPVSLVLATGCMAGSYLPSVVDVLLQALDSRNLPLFKLASLKHRCAELSNLSHRLLKTLFVSRQVIGQGLPVLFHPPPLVAPIVTRKREPHPELLAFALQIACLPHGALELIAQLLSLQYCSLLGGEDLLHRAPLLRVTLLRARPGCLALSARAELLDHRAHWLPGGHIWRLHSHEQIHIA
eukprot:CAMPEP_0170569068 /NCGR_PEP_ID=MMETSP0224-20130122/328_1 /TAXON_ID=285029 /ORGANISM="Togula jolla, Strain CCCM 725" /LENGTH=189 /DNA_ID=CAMNT_0010891151 /DNA_START=146 /DNA_END=715 /DNA_ORIENTATION=-